MSSPSPLEPDDPLTVLKMSSCSSPQLTDSGTVGKINSSSSPEPTDSATLDKISSSSSPEPTDSGTLDKISSSSSPEPTDSGTLDKMSYSSSSKPSKSSTRLKISSCRPPVTVDSYLHTGKYLPVSDDSSDSDDSTELYDCRAKGVSGSSLISMFDRTIHSLTLQYINNANKENKFLNELRQNRKFKDVIQSLEEKGIMYLDMKMFSRCNKMGNKSKQSFKSLSVDLSVLLKRLIDICNKNLYKYIAINDIEDDGCYTFGPPPHILPHGIDNFIAYVLSSDDRFRRSLGIHVVNKFFLDNTFLIDEFDREPSDPHYLLVIDDILDKSTQARKCANWFLYKACNLEILCDDIQYTWIYNSLKLTSYANLMETSLGMNDGSDKVNMYEIYMNHQKGDFEKMYLRKFHQGVKDLEQSDIKYKVLEARKPKFERSRLCISEHNTPFCEICGWPSTWLKTFKKRGIYIKESPDWTTKQIWYNEIID